MRRVKIRISDKKSYGSYNAFEASCEIEQDVNPGEDSQLLVARLQFEARATVARALVHEGIMTTKQAEKRLVNYADRVKKRGGNNGNG